MELTDSEIVKALEELLKELKGKKQLIVSKEGVKNLCCCLQNHLDLINRLQAENEALKMDNKQLQDDVINANCNYDRLAECYSKECKETETLTLRLKNANEYEVYLTSQFKTAKTEAYKECIGKVKTEIDEVLKNIYKVRSERTQSIPNYTEDEFWNYCTGKIDCLGGLDDFCDNLLKELVGEDK